MLLPWSCSSLILISSNNWIPLQPGWWSISSLLSYIKLFLANSNMAYWLSLDAAWCEAFLIGDLWRGNQPFRAAMENSWNFSRKNNLQSSHGSNQAPCISGKSTPEDSLEFRSNWKLMIGICEIRIHRVHPWKSYSPWSMTWLSECRSLVRRGPATWFSLSWTVWSPSHTRS